MFISLVLLWLRVHNVRGPIRIRLDNGAEFCGGSRRKLREWNRWFGFLGAWLDPIPAGAKHLLGVIENAHRQDDEAFLMVHAERCLHTLAFIERAQRWQDTWNYLRPHFGYGMGGMTPLERLRSSGSLLADRILQFPVLLLEGVMRPLGSFVSYLNRFKDVQYVLTKCPF